MTPWICAFEFTKSVDRHCATPARAVRARRDTDARRITSVPRTRRCARGGGRDDGDATAG